MIGQFTSIQKGTELTVSADTKENIARALPERPRARSAAFPGAD